MFLVGLVSEQISSLRFDGQSQVVACRADATARGHPTYNERDNLPALVAALLAIDGLQVLVVDDNSPDGTGDEGGRARRRERRPRVGAAPDGPRGLGRSYIDGMAAALRTDATHICQMDADFSHDPADCRGCSRPAPAPTWSSDPATSRADELQQLAGARVMLSAFANWYVRAITRLPVHDCTSGFRCWRRELLAGCRSTASCPTATPFWWRWRGRRTAPAAASSKCRSRSSSGAKARRRCPGG